MRINELIVENNIDEGPGWDQVKAGAKQVGQGIATGAPAVAGSLAKGVGAVAGGVTGAWDKMKQGFAAGRKSVGGTATPADTDSPSDAAPSTTAQAAAQPVPAATPSLYNQVKANVNQLDAKGKQRILAILQKQLGSAQAARPAAAPAGGAMAQMANQLNPTTSTGGTVTSLPTGRMHTANPSRVATPESVTFHSKFLDKEI